MSEIVDIFRRIPLPTQSHSLLTGLIPLPRWHDYLMPAAPLAGLVVLIDEAPIADTIAVLEVLIQEGFTTVSLPSTHNELGDIATMYNRRLRLGVHGRDCDPLRLRELGMSFVLYDGNDTSVVATMAASELAVYPSAMTPTEIAQALKLPASGVQLYPADVLGPLMAERLAAIGLINQVVPRGGVIAYVAKQWLKAGAPAVGIDTHLIGDSLRGGDLSALRDRCRSYR